MSKSLLISIICLSLGCAAHAAERVVVAYNQFWSYVHPMGISPAQADADYDTTWFLTQSEFVSDYNGPTFITEQNTSQPGTPETPASINSGNAMGPLGYSAVDNFTSGNPLLFPLGESVPITSMGSPWSYLTQPTNGNRKASYYRTVFYTESLMARPLIRGMFDDGAVIFLDGVQVARVNISLPGNTSVPVYATTAITDGTLNPTPLPISVPQSTENTLHTIDLTVGGQQGTPGGLSVEVINPVSSLPAGEHTLAVFICSWAPSNADQLMALEMTADDGGISAGASNVVRNSQGTPTNPADDTFEFDVVVSQLGGGTGTWESNIAQHSTGQYGQTYHFGGFPATSDAVINFSDTNNPALTSVLTVSPPPPALWLGENRLGSVTAPLMTNAEETTAWLQGGNETIFHNHGDGLMHEVHSQQITLPPGGAEFQVILQVTDASPSGGFESTDVVEAYLLLYDGTNETTVNLIPAALDTNGDGALNGYSGTDYNDRLTSDELNFASRPAAAVFTESLALQYSIPAGFLTAQLMVRAANNDPSETFTLHHASFAPAGTVFDADGDTVSDADELIAGTDPANAGSRFHTVSTLGSTQMQVSFPTAANRSYRVMSSTDMVTWTQENTTSIIGDGSNQLFNLNSSPRRRYLTVQVRRGLWPFDNP